MSGSLGDNAITSDGENVNKSELEGFYDIYNKTININENNQDGSTEDLIRTNSHEYAHHENSGVGEEGADRFGYQAWDAFRDEIGSGSGVNKSLQDNWINSYSSVGGFEYGNSVAGQANYVKPCANISSTITFELPGFTPSPLETGMLITRIPTEGNFKLTGFAPTSEEDEFKLAGFSPTPEDMVITKHYDLVNGKKVGQTTADEANKGYGRPPYTEGTNVTDYETTDNEKFVRVHRGGDSEARKWIVKESEITNPDGSLMTAEQIKDKLALPNLPTQISDVTIPKGVKLREGEASKQEGWGKGGATQYEIIKERAKPEWFNERTGGLK